MTGNSPSGQAGAKWWKSIVLAALSGLRALVQSGLLLPVVGALALGLLFLAWSCEREGRLRQKLETEQVRQRAEEDAARLEARAAANLREARAQQEAARRDYESRRARLEREAAGLRERLTSLRQQEAARVAEVAALPLPQVVERVRARLGNIGIRDSGFGAREQTGIGDQALGIRETAGTRDSGLGTGAKSASVELPLNGTAASSANTRNPAPHTQPPVPSPDSRVASPESRIPSPVVLSLTEAGARAVETAFVELEACRAQSAAKDAELDNCRALGQTHQSLITQQDITIKKLNAVLADKDQILARREEAHRAELKLARGTRGSRFLSARKYLAAGVVVGVVIR